MISTTGQRPVQRMVDGVAVGDGVGVAVGVAVGVGVGVKVGVVVGVAVAVDVAVGDGGGLPLSGPAKSGCVSARDATEIDRILNSLGMVDIVSPFLCFRLP